LPAVSRIIINNERSKKMCLSCSDLSQKYIQRADSSLRRLVKVDKPINTRRSKFSLRSALIAGAIATAAMTVFTFMAPLMGFEMNIPKMLSTAMGAPIIVGWIAHFMIGEILAINFAAIFLNKANKPANLKSGALFGLIPWFIAQIMVMPVMSIINGGSYSAGFFSASIIIAMASLLGHLIFGAILGSIYRPKTVAATATA